MKLMKIYLYIGVLAIIVFTTLALFDVFNLKETRIQCMVAKNCVNEALDAGASPPSKKEKPSTSKVWSSSIGLEVYNSKTDFISNEQSLAQNVSQPYPYNFTGFPKDFKLWVFKQGDV